MPKRLTLNGVALSTQKPMTRGRRPQPSLRSGGVRHRDDGLRTRSLYKLEEANNWGVGS
jgi:hypothetical protein